MKKTNKKTKVHQEGKKLMNYNCNLLRKDKNGITLIALVITIVVLLILAGVSISALSGQNGILKNAGKAKEQTEIGNEKEILKLAANAAGMETLGENFTKTELQTELNKQIAGKYDIKEDQEGIIVTYKDSKRSYLVENNGNVTEYEIKVPIDSNTVPTGGTAFNRTVGTTDVVFLTGIGYTEGPANAPDIDEKTMIPINWNGTHWVITDKTHWEYSYDTTNKKWANVMLSDGKYKAGNVTVGTEITNEDDLGSMFVWIPRYAYKIVYFGSGTTAETNKQAYIADRSDKSKIVGYSDARGIVDATGKIPSNVTGATTSIAVGDNYRPHPAFESNVEKGGFGKKTRGIWVAKFEATSKTSSNGTNMIVPNKTSQRSVKVADIFNRSKAIGTSLNMTLDSHLMKNSEWGATAYLTESQYGRNGTEISVNQCEAYITGAGRGLNGDSDTGNETGNNQIYNSTYSSITPIQKYNGAVGMLSSTTGNVYGIYDLSGGAWERVMGFYKDSSGNIHTGNDNGSNNSGFNGYLANGNLYTSGIDLPATKYYQTYPSYNASTIGDAIYETSNTSSGNSSWNSDYSYFVDSDYPVFIRGGVWDYSYFAGAFSFYYSDGGANSNDSFRPVLVF